MRTYEEAQYEESRLQAQVLSDCEDSEAWSALARYVSRHGGCWKDSWEHFKSTLRSYPQADTFAFIRGFLRHYPDREELIFLHWPGQTPQMVRGPLRNVMYQLGYRNLILQEIDSSGDISCRAYTTFYRETMGLPPRECSAWPRTP